MEATSQVMVQNPDEMEFIHLLLKIGNKDESALSQLYELTVSRVYGLAFKILLNEADAEEVVCDVYSQLWHKAGDFKQAKGSAISWILLICRCRALDLLRKKRPEFTSGDLINNIAETSLNDKPDDMINAIQEGTAVHQAMLQLSEVQRQLISLAYFKDLSHKEISTCIQLPLGTVKSHIRRALQIMHSLIEL